MRHGNQTTRSDFTLMGLFSSQSSLVFFSSLCIIFSLTLAENTLLILLIHSDSCLHSPMYFLLSHLSFMDILHISNIVPKMIFDFLSCTRTISFAGCGFQIFLTATLISGECLLLAAMSYDRCVAICHPLRYATLMSDRVSVLMAVGAWMVGTLNSTVHTVYVLHFPFCEPRVIDHYFCEIPALLKLYCVDTSRYERGVDVSGIIFLLIPFLVISVSYAKILYTDLKIKSSEARRKSFSTCSFHMAVVVMFYGPFIFTYLRPKSYHTPGQDKFLAIFYTTLTPSLNPAIYSFRNKDVLKAMKSVIKNSVLCKNSNKKF